MKYNVEMLSKIEYDEIWNTIFKFVDFRPSIDVNTDAFSFSSMNVHTYDIVLSSDDEFMNKFNNFFLQIFTGIIEQTNADFIYALSWNLPGFKYNPRLELSPNFKKNLVGDVVYVVDDSHFSYIPSPYPDGDYNIFSSSDMSWIYYSDPWRNKIYIIGDILEHQCKIREEELKYFVTSDNK